MRAPPPAPDRKIANRKSDEGGGLNSVRMPAPFAPEIITYTNVVNTFIYSLRTYVGLIHYHSVSYNMKLNLLYIIYVICNTKR